jgi:hypothetical protein
LDPCLDDQLGKDLCYFLPLELVVRSEHPDSLGNTKVGEDQKAFAVGRLLKKASSRSGKLGMIVEQETQQHIGIEQIFFHKYLPRRASRAFSRSSDFVPAGTLLLRQPARSIKLPASGRIRTPSWRIS